MRPIFLASAVAAMIGATGCVVHQHPGEYTYRYETTEYRYTGAHPIPDHGDAWCLIESAHVHDFAPDRSYYTYRDDYYVYSGPTVVWYYDLHPTPHGSHCSLRGRHSHDYHPGYHHASSYEWDGGHRGYMYRSSPSGHSASPARPPSGQPTYNAPPGRGATSPRYGNPPRPPSNGYNAYPGPSATPPGRPSQPGYNAYPGQSATPPGRPSEPGYNRPPGHGGTPPGQSNRPPPPVQSNNPPSSGGFNPPPGHGGTPPGHGGTPPGHNPGNTPPGHVNNPGRGNGNGNGNGRGNGNGNGRPQLSQPVRENGRPNMVAPNSNQVRPPRQAAPYDKDDREVPHKMDPPKSRDTSFRAPGSTPSYGNPPNKNGDDDRRVTQKPQPGPRPGRPVPGGPSQGGGSRPPAPPGRGR